LKKFYVSVFRPVHEKIRQGMKTLDTFDNQPAYYSFSVVVRFDRGCVGKKIIFNRRVVI